LRGISANGRPAAFGIRAPISYAFGNFSNGLPGEIVAHVYSKALEKFDSILATMNPSEINSMRSYSCTPDRISLSTASTRLVALRSRSFAGYKNLRECSVRDIDSFWISIWDYFDLRGPLRHVGYVPNPE
jgi:hypothetical protein